MDSRGYLTINASQVLGHKELSFGLVTSWGRNLLSLEDGDTTYQVQNIFAPTLVSAYGLKLGILAMELGLSVPLVVMSGDREPNDLGVAGDPNDDEDFGFEGQGLGDIGLHFKMRLLNSARGPKIGLSVVGSLYLPTASEQDKWLGEGSLTPQVLGVLEKEFGRSRRLRIALTGGLRARVGTTEWIDNMPSSNTPPLPVTSKRIEVGPAVPFGAAIAYALSPQRFEVVAEVFGELPLGGENYFPLEAIGGIKVYLAKNSFLSLGAGRGLMLDKGGNPDLRAFLAIVFEPQVGDSDGDGIKDDLDQCPGESEDYDDFEDEDGCPDLDNDRDGILDVDDKCTNEPEDQDGFEDEDGCPEGNKLDRDGDGILDEQDECPDESEDKDGFQDEDGCPELDNDNDGILDVDDLCADDAEDQDGFEDEDGCPELDNDRDRILDEDDQCPNEPETYNGKDDEDGCPDRSRVVVTDTKIEILDKVYFEYNKATIKTASFEILDTLAATLQGNPEILRIEIQGHTDERGDEGYNLRLSEARANEVVQYLINKGVDPERLEARGYGEEQPLDPRKNEEAYANNRRVEFLIIKRSSD